jgi:hypothetical protein
VQAVRGKLLDVLKPMLGARRAAMRDVNADSRTLKCNCASP